MGALLISPDYGSYSEYLVRIRHPNHLVFLPRSSLITREYPITLDPDQRQSLTVDDGSFWIKVRVGNEIIASHFGTPTIFLANSDHLGSPITRSSSTRSPMLLITLLITFIFWSRVRCFAFHFSPISCPLPFSESRPDQITNNARRDFGGDVGTEEIGGIAEEEEEGKDGSKHLQKRPEKPDRREKREREGGKRTAERSSADMCPDEQILWGWGP